MLDRLQKKTCQNICQKVCQNRMLDRMTETNVGLNVGVYARNHQTACLNINEYLCVVLLLIYIYICMYIVSRWYVVFFVRTVCQGGGHWKKVLVALMSAFSKDYLTDSENYQQLCQYQQPLRLMDVESRFH